MWFSGTGHFLSSQIIITLRLVFIEFYPYAHPLSLNKALYFQPPPYQLYSEQRKKSQSKIQSWWWFSLRNGQLHLKAHLKTLLTYKYYLIASATYSEIFFITVQGVLPFDSHIFIFYLLSHVKILASRMSHRMRVHCQSNVGCSLGTKQGGRG